MENLKMSLTDPQGEHLKTGGTGEQGEHLKMLTGSRKKGNIENKPVSFPGLLPELKEEGGNLKDKRCDGKRILPAATQGGNKKGNQ